MEKFQNKYRIPSNRNPRWDYSGNGKYFITIVTQNRECNLGSIINKQIILSDFGKIVADELLKSFRIRNELILDEYIVMPNHLHLIIILKKSSAIEANGHSPQSQSALSYRHGHSLRVPIEPHGRAAQSAAQSKFKFQLIRKPKSISSFIAGFKSAVNSKIDDFIDETHLEIPKFNKNNHFFQSNYHDRIIRNHEEYKRIKQYILNNPSKWHRAKINKSI